MKKTIGLLILIIIFSLALPASGSFWVKGDGFYYAPNYGEFLEELVEHAPAYNVKQQLSPGMGSSFSAGYDFTNNWTIRLDMFKFTGIADYHRLGQDYYFYFKTSTSPTLLSLMYPVFTHGKLNFFLGAGKGVFSSELIAESDKWEGAHWTDAPIGYQGLIGLDYRLKNKLSICGELRYLSAKTEYPSYYCLDSCSTDWSGLFGSVGIRVLL